MDEPGYTSLRVYYFSGTGNARRLAQWLVSCGEKRGVPSVAESIEHLSGPPEGPSAGELIGFAYPVHGFTTIWAMLKFILKFPRAQTGTAVFAVTSLGGCKLGKWIVPGWEGNGLYLPMLILKLKGYRWAGAYPVRSTPENWTSLIPGYSEASGRWMLDKARVRVDNFMERLLSRRWAFHGILTALLWLPLIPLTCTYLFWGRFFLAKTFFPSAQCNGCGLCAQNCPVGAIEMKGGRPFWKFSCESCMRCLNYCPKKAVQAHLPLWILIWLLALHPLAQAVQDRVACFGTVWGWVAYCTVAVAGTATLYRIWFLLLKLSWVRRVFEWTAPTRYYHRYHEPDTEWGDHAKALTECKI